MLETSMFEQRPNEMLTLDRGGLEQHIHDLNTRSNAGPRGRLIQTITGVECLARRALNNLSLADNHINGVFDHLQVFEVEIFIEERCQSPN